MGDQQIADARQAYAVPHHVQATARWEIHQQPVIQDGLGTGAHILSPVLGHLAAQRVFAENAGDTLGCRGTQTGQFYDCFYQKLHSALIVGGTPVPAVSNCQNQAVEQFANISK